ncbi:MAG TPA: class I SAM-dependent methyltransferase [Bacteroidota bacterium]|nr:class I SAM-dependent methyltransferase [Bacteroidota bacterium]
MSCPSCLPSTKGTDKFFTRTSKRYLKKFKRKGLTKQQQLLIEGIRKSNVADKSILDIGCGIGMMHLTLLKEGASNSTGIDLAAGMLAGARNLAKESSLEGRTSYIDGDFLAVHASAPNADITILDKVVCCYENVGDLVKLSTAKTNRTYALSYPKPGWIRRVVFGTPILMAKIFRLSFRPYLHDWNAMTESIVGAGFTPVYEATTFLWMNRVFERR